MQTQNFSEGTDKTDSTAKGEINVEFLQKDDICSSCILPPSEEKDKLVCDNLACRSEEYFCGVPIKCVEQTTGSFASLDQFHSGANSRTGGCNARNETLEDRTSRPYIVKVRFNPTPSVRDVWEDDKDFFFDQPVGAAESGSEFSDVVSGLLMFKVECISNLFSKG